MTTYQIACTIGTTDSTAELGLEIWIDERQLFSTEHVADTQQLTFDIEDDEAEHKLRFIMTNKTFAHTTVDDQGNIVSDARLTIADVAFDEIKLGQIFVDLPTYTHNFNGTQPETVDKFYGEMGCIGTVSLQFTTPIYLWLLEHM